MFLKKFLQSFICIILVLIDQLPHTHEFLRHDRLRVFCWGPRDIFPQSCIAANKKLIQSCCLAVGSDGFDRVEVPLSLWVLYFCVWVQFFFLRLDLRLLLLSDVVYLKIPVRDKVLELLFEKLLESLAKLFLPLENNLLFSWVHVDVN